MLQKVVPTPKTTYQEALDTCAADGATLPKLLTTEDVLALKHYLSTWRNGDFDNAWAGLLKVNNTIKCTDNTCDGLLEWPGGPAFAFEASVHKELDGTDKSELCFKFNGVRDTLVNHLCNKTLLVICQFTPTEVPSGYELRNGKYYKVLAFI